MTDQATANTLPLSAQKPRFGWRVNLALFLLTVVSVFWVGGTWTGSASITDPVAALVGGWSFAVPLLLILVAHEFGHYIAARIHGVPASLPFFLPLPKISPFGTLGAIILMPPIRSRKALLDVGAAGPLAGMVFAVPILYYGLTLSEVVPRSDGNYLQEGSSLLYAGLKSLVFGSIPPTHDVLLHPTAVAGWAGLFVTFLNLLPYGQLDGGHISYAVFGDRHNKIVPWFVGVPLLLVVYNAALYAWPPVSRALNEGFSAVPVEAWLPVGAAINWVVLLALLLVMRRTTGAEHPPVVTRELSSTRRGVGMFTLALFVLLFMPTPLVVH